MQPHNLSTVRHLEHTADEASRGLPALLAEAERLASTLMTGAHGRKRAGTGETFWQYRDYTINDPASSIDWRQSARSPRRLYVRETEWETAATIRFWCNGADGFAYGSGDGPTKKWRSLVLSVALAFALTRAGEHVGTLPQASPARRGAQAVMELAETLFSQHLSKELPPSAEFATHAVYISDFYMPTDLLCTRIQQLAASGIPAHFVEVTDPSEETFPFEGHTVFHTPDTPKRGFQFGNARTIRDDYIALRAAHREALKDACRRYGVTLIRHSTEAPAGLALTALHQAIGRGV